MRQALDSHIQQAVAQKQFSGSVLVAKEGEIMLRCGYGMANIELEVPNTPEMKFRIGSITKPFTATAIMQYAAGTR